MYLPKKHIKETGIWALALFMGALVSMGSLYASDKISEDHNDRRPQLEQFIIHYTNEVREKHGLNKLTYDPNLELISRRHSDDMIKRDYTGHITPEGLTPKDRVSNQYRSFIGKTTENIWLLSGSWKGLPYNQSSSPIKMAKRVVSEWMESPTHRKNILTEGLTHIGIGVSASYGKLLVTQLLTQKIAQFTQPVPLEKPAGSSLGLSVDCDVGNADYVMAFENLNPQGNSDKYQNMQKASKIRLPREAGAYRIVLLLKNNKKYDVYKGPALYVNKGDKYPTGPLSSFINNSGTE